MPPLYEGSMLYMPTSPPGMSITEGARLLQVQPRTNVWMRGMLLVELSASRVRARSPIRLAEHDGLGEAGLACFLVLAVHLFRGLGQR